MIEKEKIIDRNFSDFDLGVTYSQKKYVRPAERATDTVEISESADDQSSEELKNDGSFKIPVRSIETELSIKSAPIRTWSSPAYAPRKPISGKDRIRTSRYSGRGADFEKNNLMSDIDPRRSPKDEPSAEKESLFEYSGDGAIRTVKVKSWNGGYGFYEKFVRDAIRSCKTEPPDGPVERVPYFSYIPKYSSLTTAQWRYYLYFRKSAEEGKILPETDFSYVMLYIYEIINLAGVIKPDAGAARLGKLWSMYRGVHPSLDKYMSEWMSDYCLIYGIPLPKSVCSFASDAASRSTLKEFYYDAAVKSDETGALAAGIVIDAMSDYNASRSRSAADIENFRERLTAYGSRVIAEMMIREIGIFSPSGQKETELKRDAFCGSLCACSVKRRIELSIRTPLRSPENRRIITDVMKGCENVLRAESGVRSRLSAPSLKNGELKELFNFIFGEKLHGSGNRPQKDEAFPSREEAEYLKLYDMPDEPLTLERAAEIELNSWRNTALLTDEEFGCGQPSSSDESSYADCGFENPQGTISTERAEIETDAETENDADKVNETEHFFSAPLENDSVSFAVKLNEADPKLAEIFYSAVREAKGEDGVPFSEGCRREGVFADDGAARVNDLATEIFGDILLERSGAGYVIIEDYLDEI